MRDKKRGTVHENLLCVFHNINLEFISAIQEMGTFWQDIVMNISIAKNLIAFGIVVTVGLAGSIGLQQIAMNRLKVNGPIYEQVINGKDLVADILPPPLFVVEAHMLALEAGDFPEVAAANAAKIAKLERNYEDRRAYWQSSSLPENLRDQLANTVLTKSDVFWQEMDSAVLRMRRLRPIDFAVAAAIYRLRMSRELIRESRMSSL